MKRQWGAGKNEQALKNPGLEILIILKQRAGLACYKHWIIFPVLYFLAKNKVFKQTP